MNAPEKIQRILTKIVATIGPACADPAVLVRMIEEGVRVVRINFSHGSFEDFERALNTVRTASELTQVPVGVLGDLSGPKIRICQVPEPFELMTGARVEFVTEGDVVIRDAQRDTVIVPTTYPDMVHEVEPGHRVLVDDGSVRMLAVAREPGRLVCRVTQGGPISSKKGVNLPDTTIAAPSMTEHDETCARWALKHGLDFLALSFVRKAEDVQQLRAFLKAEVERGKRVPPIIAKIEKPEAVREIEAICAASDAIMVARGDLGVEMDLARVPVIQKQIMRASHDHGKPVIVATQMLQSMIEQATPTRAEVSDVANAILDGADALMLSGETAVGRYPVQVVRTMARTAAITEADQAAARRDSSPTPRYLKKSRYRTAALAHGVSTVAHDLGARYVVLWSEAAGGARYLSQNRLEVPVIAISSSKIALRKMSLLFGVTPVWMAQPTSSEAFVDAVDELLLNQGWARAGDPIVIVKGEPLGTPGVTNEIRIHYVGDVCRIEGYAAPAE